jgi:hypothetical protein
VSHAGLHKLAPKEAIMGYKIPADGVLVPHGLTVVIRGPGKSKRNMTSGCRLYGWMKILEVSDKTLAKNAGIELMTSEAPKSKATSKG